MRSVLPAPPRGGAGRKLDWCESEIREKNREGKRRNELKGRGMKRCGVAALAHPSSPRTNWPLRVKGKKRSTQKLASFVSKGGVENEESSS
jgi:hypothetical protein